MGSVPVLLVHPANCLKSTHAKYHMQMDFTFGEKKLGGYPPYRSWKENYAECLPRFGVIYRLLFSQRYFMCTQTPWCIEVHLVFTSLLPVHSSASHKLRSSIWNDNKDRLKSFPSSEYTSICLSLFGSLQSSFINQVLNLKLHFSYINWWLKKIIIYVLNLHHTILAEQIKKYVDISYMLPLYKIM